MENIKKNKQSLPLRGKNIILLLLGALIIRLILAGEGTLALDQNTFIAWGMRAAEVGFGRFYDAWSDYLPGYIYVLWFLAKLAPITNISTEVLYKLPAIVSDLAVGGIIYFVLRKKRKVALFAACAFLFNPAVLANSTFWGQVDILTSLTTLLSIVLINIWPLSAISLAVGMAIKPQAMVALPVVFALGFANGWRIKSFLRYGLILAITFVILFLPFASGNLPEFIITRFTATVDQYPYSSINAFNFWGLFGFWKEDSVSPLINPKNIGALLLTVVGLVSLIKYRVTSGKPYHVLAVLFLVNFLFFTRMHERHLLPALAPLAIAAANTPILWFVYAGFSATYIANMHYSYQWITQDFAEVFPEPLIKLMILANLALLVALVKQTLRPGKAKLLKLVQLVKSVKVNKPEIFDRLGIKQEKVLLTSIILFSIIIRLFRLGIPETDYFDEIYHAFTAREMLVGDARPWHWSSEHPEGFAYEWTHPPLAKEIMAASMSIFGINSFAWRLPGAMAGVAIVLLTYLIAKELFKSRDIAVLSALLVSMDGLILTMSRIGTADVYFVAFALAAYYLFLRERDFGSALFLGMAAASKWSTLWFLPIFALTFVLLQRKFRRSLVWFPLLVPLVYLASYLPMFTFGHDLTTFWGMQKQMWWYHSGLEATHPYTSPWWSWPIMLRPVYLYQNYSNGIVANIYAIGNPLFFWSGLLAMIGAVWLFLKERLAVLFVLGFGYAVLFAPWATSPRIMFVYHYLPSLPFMGIALAYILKRYKALTLPVVIGVAAAFVYFFPHWTALPVPEWLDKTYYWFSSWR